MKKQITKRYSEAFKRQVVKEYEAGVSVNQLRRRYGIGSHHAVYNWVKQYGHAGLRHETVVIQRADERERERALAQRVQELEKAVAQLTLDKIVLQASLAEAEELLGCAVEKKRERPLLSGATLTS